MEKKTVDDGKKPDEAQIDQQTNDTAVQVESVMERIMEDHPHLRAVHDALRPQEEHADKFARDFLRGLRQRLQS